MILTLKKLQAFNLTCPSVMVLDLIFDAGSLSKVIYSEYRGPNSIKEG